MSVELECKECGLLFKVKNSRAGAKFCSVACCGRSKSGNGNQPKIKSCTSCGVEFRSRFNKSRGKYQEFCSKKCQSDNAMTSLTCDGCGCEFNRRKTDFDRKNPSSVFCSKECRGKNLNGSMCGGYVGGSYINSDGFRMINDNNGNFIQEHRMLVQDYIGRKLLHHSEPILHINGIKHDNELSNLYVCRDMSEMGFILKSYDIPYPVKSNVEQLNLDVIDG